jgi:hypothetical protein
MTGGFNFRGLLLPAGHEKARIQTLSQSPIRAFICSALWMVFSAACPLLAAARSEKIAATQPNAAKKV